MGNNGPRGHRLLEQWLHDQKFETQLEAAQFIGLDAGLFNKILHRKRRPGRDTAVKIQRKTGILVDAWVA